MNWREEVEKFKQDMTPVQSRISCNSIKFGFFGIVGGGKSTTAGIFAVGITPEGLIGWVDGEGERSGFAIDVVCDMAVKHYGGTKEQWLSRFKVIHLDSPFNPLRVIAAKEKLEAEGCKTVILDIMSQAWDSEGGYLDLKEAEIDRTTGGNDAMRAKHAQSAAAKIKPWTHQQLVNSVNGSKVNLVLLFQAKKKWDAKKNTVSGVETPIQESGLTRTAIAVARVECQMVNGSAQGGFCSFSGGLDEGVKSTHPSILELLPKNGEQFKFEHAEALRNWITGVTPSKPEPLKVNPIKLLQNDIWKLTKPHREKNDKTWGSCDGWLLSKGIITDAETVPAMTVERLAEVKSKVEEFLNQPKA